MLSLVMTILALANWTLSNTCVSASANRENDDIDDRLLGLIAKNRINLRAVDEVVDDLKEWLNTITKQNDDIAELGLQAAKLLLLADDVVSLGDIVDQLSQNAPSLDAEISQLQDIIRDLRIMDDQHDKSLALADIRLADHVKALDDLEVNVLNTLQKIEERREIVRQVDGFLNGQITEQLEFSLTDKQRVQTLRASANFGGRTPHIMLGLCNLTFSHGSKRYKLFKTNRSPHPGTQNSTSGVYRSNDIVPVSFPERVAWDASIHFDPLTRDVTVSFNDYSTDGWKVTEISALPLLLAVGVLG